MADKARKSKGFEIFSKATTDDHRSLRTVFNPVINIGGLWFSMMWCGLQSLCASHSPVLALFAGYPLRKLSISQNFFRDIGVE